MHTWDPRSKQHHTSTPFDTTCNGSLHQWEPDHSSIFIPPFSFSSLFLGKLYHLLHTTTDRSLDPPSSPSFQNQEKNFSIQTIPTNFSIQTISETNLNPKQTQPQLHKNQTPEARKRRKRDRVQNRRPNPWTKNHTQKTFHFTNPKPKIDELRNPNWGYPITKSIHRAETKTRTIGSRDVEREREVLGEGNYESDKLFFL